MGDDIRTTRQHAILTERWSQVQLNLLAEAGGSPYIKARLSRFPSESIQSWSGNLTAGIAPRLNRAFLINYAGRIARKIPQYVFSQGVVRDGIDEGFRKDATKTGVSIDDLMKAVCRAQIAGGWAWVGVDRGALGVNPATGQRTIRSLAERRAVNDRVFFTLWKATEVVDWAFDASGELLWLITEETVYLNDDPSTPSTVGRVRTIWERGGGIRLHLNAAGELEREEPFTISAAVVPFVNVGTPSTSPHWFDDVETVQASLLNLESAHHENLIRCVFPQLVMPSDTIQEVMSMANKTFDEAVEMVRGLEWPLFEPKDCNGLTRLLMPSAVDLKAIPDEIMRRRTELLEIVGQALRNSDSRQVASAEAKAWDHQDITATLTENADTLEETERKAVSIAKKLDSSFKDYSPQYPRQFDLPNLTEDLKALVELENSSNIPPAVVRQVAKAKVKILDRIVKMSPEALKAAMDEIETMDLKDIDGQVGAIAGAGAGDTTGIPGR